MSDEKQTDPRSQEYAMPVAINSLSEMTAEFVKSVLRERQIGKDGFDMIQKVDVQFFEQERTPFQWFLKLRIYEFPIKYEKALKIVKLQGILIGVLIGSALMGWLMHK